MTWPLFQPGFTKSKISNEDPVFKRIRSHAEMRLTLKELTTAKERLFACKEFLRLEMELLWRFHRQGESGLRVTHANSLIVDVLIETLYDYALHVFTTTHNGDIPGKVCTLALGGYGRNELCPKSDVDIMFLCPTGVDSVSIVKLQEILIQEILYPLWDLGLKVGHSTRNYEEAIEEAKNSVESKNAMLESRHVCGDEDIFDDFQKKYREFYLSDSPLEYAQKRLYDQAERRKKYGNSVFMQQPNIKNGVGGLRDYQNILWVSFVRLNAGTLEEIQAKSYLTDVETHQLREAYSFLLRVRSELHFRSQRPTDILDLESQPDVAWALGYKHHDVFKRIEAFMHDYFRNANNIFTISNLIERRLATSDTPQNETASLNSDAKPAVAKRELFDGFLLENNLLTYDTKDVFKKDPARLIRVFRHAQQKDCEIQLDLIVLIRTSLPLLDARTIASDAANRSFRAILQTVGNVAPTLFLMHECGVLGRFMPEFGRLTCHVQHEFYHLYTADIHILRTLEELDHVFADNTPIVEKYREALRKTRIPALLYLMLLLHDLGKAFGIKGHAEAGLRITKPILERMQIPEEHHEQILFTIQNHFEMARFTLNYDVDDPITAQTFAKSVDNPENLHYLYVHTFCDARGTSHELWNGYKDTILARLYERTLEQFKGQEHVNQKYEREKEIMKSKLLSKNIPDVSREEIDAHFNLLPDRYFMNHTEDEIEQHLKMIHHLLAKISDANSIGSLEPVIEWHDDLDQGLTIAHVVTWDRAGLFYKLAGAFTLSNLSVISSKVVTREDHITIDTFYLVDENGGIVKNRNVQDLFRKTVRESLLHGKDLTADVLKKAENAHRSLYTKQTERLRTNIPPVVDIYHELSLKRTIVEIQATDYIGLLYQISKAIYDNGFDINFARISTQREAALDVFYIENIKRNEPIATSRLMELRRCLEAIIADPTTNSTEATG